MGAIDVLIAVFCMVAPYGVFYAIARANRRETGHAMGQSAAVYILVSAFIFAMIFLYGYHGRLGLYR